MPISDVEQRYVERWFLSIDMVARAVGLTTSEALELTAAGCAPGPIYGFSQNTGWWSALAAYTGRAPSDPPAEARLWYSSGAVWWLRRAILNRRDGKSALEAATASGAFFKTGFEQHIAKTAFANFAYPDCFKAGEIDMAAVEETSASEWDAWVRGAYGVCLRFFSAESCIRKEALAARIKAHMAAAPGDEYRLDEFSLLSLSEELAALVLPFAPWERADGTPGRAIDAPLTLMKLGGEFPYE